MLLAAEGGGFFSASASGYSKGLTLLLLGQQKKEDNKPMKVSPWDQDRLVQLDSTKNRLSRSCASFICFGRASAGLDTPSPLKVGPAQHQESSDDSVATPPPDKGKHHVADVEDEDNSDVVNVVLKSNLKKSLKGAAAAAGATHRSSEHIMETIDAAEDAAEHVQRRKVQWMDSCGSELFEIKEFEPSETGASDDELQGRNEKSCICSIM